MTANSVVVVLGGTFDPVHNAHLMLLRGSVRMLNASCGIAVVEAGHRHRRQPVAGLADRRSLVQKALAEEALLEEALLLEESPFVEEAPLVEGSQIHLDGGLVGAVTQLEGSGFDVNVIFGSDSASHLDRWNGRGLLNGATLWSVPRGGDLSKEVPGVGVLPLNLPTLSATEVRVAAAAGKPLHRMVPPGCMSKIGHLYRYALGSHERIDICESA